MLQMLLGWAGNRWLNSMRAAREKIMHPAIRKCSPVLASAGKKNEPVTIAAL